MGLDVDLSANGLGVRTARYAIILEDLVVKYVEVRQIIHSTLRIYLNLFLVTSRWNPNRV
jgi:peroxiredoxin